MKETQSDWEEKDNHSISKDFLLRTDPYIFTSIETELFEWSNETSRVFSALNFTRQFLLNLQFSKVRLLNLRQRSLGAL